MTGAFVQASARGALGTPGRRGLVMITILAIVGTLSACGRYGSPVRVAPSGVGVETEVDGNDRKVGDVDDAVRVGAEDPSDTESSDRKAESDRTE